jgi:hypothetical protein
MKLGYARVSTNEQDTAAQVSALKSAGCEKIFREKASGGRWDRPELHRLMDQLRKGDILVCWRLDRISRSVRDILMIMERIKEAEAGFKSSFRGPFSAYFPCYFPGKALIGLKTLEGSGSKTAAILRTFFVLVISAEALKKARRVSGVFLRAGCQNIEQKNKIFRSMRYSAGNCSVNLRYVPELLR